jgi:hypothetical protein
MNFQFTFFDELKCIFKYKFRYNCNYFANRINRIILRVELSIRLINPFLGNMKLDLIFKYEIAQFNPRRKHAEKSCQIS